MRCVLLCGQGDRYMMKLFRDYVFHQVHTTACKRPFSLGCVAHADGGVLQTYLIDRYKFHGTPMFLAYCGGKLVFAEPTFAHFRCTRDCMEKTLKECEGRVKRGDYLPDGFRFDVSNAK